MTFNGNIKINIAELLGNGAYAKVYGVMGIDHNNNTIDSLRVNDKTWFKIEYTSESKMNTAKEYAAEKKLALKIGLNPYHQSHFQQCAMN